MRLCFHLVRERQLEVELDEFYELFYLIRSTKMAHPLSPIIRIDLTAAHCSEEMLDLALEDARALLRSAYRILCDNSAAILDYLGFVRVDKAKAAEYGVSNNAQYYAKTGNLRYVQYMIEHNKVCLAETAFDTYFPIYSATKTIEFLRKHGYKFSERSMNYVLNHEDIDGFLALCDANVKIPIIVRHKLVSMQYTDVIKYLHDHHKIDMQQCAMDAIAMDNIDALQELIEFGVELTEQLCTEAARCGNVDILRMLVANGAPAGADTYACATKNNRLDVLRYLDNQNCASVSSGLCIVPIQAKRKKIIKESAHERAIMVQ